jgi:hypothetical protein
MSLLLHDTDEDIRAEAALALYEAGRNTPKQDQITKALRRAADEDESRFSSRSRSNLPPKPSSRLKTPFGLTREIRRLHSLRLSRFRVNECN